MSAAGEEKARRKAEAEDFEKTFLKGDLIRDGLELTEEIIQRLGIHPTLSKDAFDKLWSNKIRTWRNLLDLESREDAVEATGAEKGSGTAIWNAVQDYKKRRDERSKVPDKAFREVKENIPDIASFILRQLKEELQNRGVDGDGPLKKRLQVDGEERFIELVDELEGLHGARKRLFVRDAMRSVVGRIISYLEGSPQRWLLLGGTRGCGKSVVGSLVVILLAAKGHVVLYQQRGTTMLILTEKVSEEDKAMLDDIIKRTGIPAIPLTNSVWKLEPTHAAFQQEFLIVPNFIFVQDLGDDVVTVPPQNGNGKRLIISSPNADKLAVLRRKDLAKLIIMPTWTLDEIKQIEPRDPDAVESRFKRVGGIPRWVVDKEKGVTEGIQDEQIRNLPVSSLALVFGGDGYLNLPSQVDKSDSKKSTEVIFRIEPISESNDEKCQVVLSSSYVKENLAERYLKGTEDEVLQFVSVIQKTYRLTEFRGRTLEGTVHRAIKQGSENSVFKTMSILRLDAEKDPVPVRTDVPTMQFKTVREFVDILSIPMEQLHKGAYFHAKRKTEPTIDAFALVDEAFLKTHFSDHPALKVNFGRGFKGEKLFVLFIQITIADKHVVDGTVLRKRQEELQKMLGLPILPMAFCFISWPGGISRQQEVTYLNTKAKARVSFKNQNEFGPQYVVRLRGKFDEIAARIAS